MKTCTVRTATAGECGAPAVYELPGTSFAECAEHHVPELVVPLPPATPVPKTRTTRPFVLVRAGEIVGYAEAVTPAVRRRALRLRAEILPTKR